MGSVSYNSYPKPEDFPCYFCHDSLKNGDPVVAHEEGGEKHPIHLECIKKIVANSFDNCSICRKPINADSVRSLKERLVKKLENINLFGNLNFRENLREAFRTTTDITFRHLTKSFFPGILDGLITTAGMNYLTMYEILAGKVLSPNVLNILSFIGLMAANFVEKDFQDISNRPFTVTTIAALTALYSETTIAMGVPRLDAYKFSMENCMAGATVIMIKNLYDEAIDWCREHPAFRGVPYRLDNVLRICKGGGYSIYGMSLLINIYFLMSRGVSEDVCYAYEDVCYA